MKIGNKEITMKEIFERMSIAEETEMYMLLKLGSKKREKALAEIRNKRVKIK